MSIKYLRRKGISRYKLLVLDSTLNTKVVSKLQHNRAFGVFHYYLSEAEVSEYLLRASRAQSRQSSVSFGSEGDVKGKSRLSGEQNLSMTIVLDVSLEV